MAEIDLRMIESAPSIGRRKKKLFFDYIVPSQTVYKPHENLSFLSNIGFILKIYQDSVSFRNKMFISTLDIEGKARSHLRATKA